MALATRLLHVVLLTVTLGIRAGDAATFDVDMTNDDAAATACTAAANDCSLRGAVLAANALSEASTVHVPAGTYVLAQSSTCTYRVLTSSPGIFTSALESLCLAKNITIEGAGADVTIIDGDAHTRVVFVSADSVAELRGVTITGGTGQASIFAGGGGGIMNHGTLTVTDAVVTGNTLPPGATGNSGAGIQNFGTLTLSRSTVTKNLAPLHAGGGGIHNDGSAEGVLVIRDSTISDNVIASIGGGIHNQATATIVNSTISGNTANGLGGGLANLHAGGNVTASLTIINTTISGNHAGSLGGGFYNSNLTTTFFNNVTITDNQADGTRGGGGIHNDSSTAFLLQNTLIAGNRNAAGAPAPDCLAGAEGNGVAVTSQGHNLIQDTTRCTIVGDATGNLTGVDPLLGLLADNGGPTKTHALGTGSPAIDAGRPAPLPGGGGFGCAATDQGGTLRPLGAACDIGAHEAAEAAALHVVPDHGGNAGVVTALVFGFPPSAQVTVKLTRAGQADIEADPAVLGGAGILSARFDLTGAAPGAWDVVVAGASGAPVVLAGGFTVEAAGAPDLWVDVIGPPFIRLGRPARYTVFFGNRGNVDAVGVPLMLSTPAGFGYRIFAAIAPPPVLPGQARDDWSDVPLTVRTEAGSTSTDVPLLLPILPSGYTGSFQIELTSPVASGSYALLVGIGLPIFTPDLDPAVVATAVAAVQAYLAEDGDVVVIPPATVPVLATYARDQIEAVADQGRAQFMASLGAGLPMHSIARLHLDLVFYGASLVAEEEAVLRLPIASRLFAALLAGVAPAESAAQSQNGPITPCTGQVLGEGETCTPVDRIFPPDIPPPPGCDTKKPSTFKNCKPTEAHCNSLGTHHVVGTGPDKACVPDKPPKGCAIIDNPLLGTGNADCKRWPIAPRGSIDPNDKAGSLGATAAHALAATTLPITYTVQFENLETASAAAQEVVVTDQLDAATLDLSTFSLGPMGFGDVSVVPASGVRTYSGGIDLRPAQNLFVAIHAGLDDATGVVTWRFTTLDPETLALPADPLAGFLPPNVTAPEGQGSLTFTVQPKPGLATGTTLCNEAEIVFDVNAPIVTPEWCNVFDQTPPASTVSALGAAQSSPSFLVAWTGTDTPGGVATYTVFVSENDGPFTAFVTDTTATSATFPGAVGSTYAFYSVARDAVGNVEAAPTQPDTETTVSGPPVHDLAVTKIVAPKKVALSVKTPAKTAAVKVEIQNRSPHTETIPSLGVLAQLVTLQATSLGACPAPQPVLAQKKKLPSVLKSKQKLTVVFSVTFDCANDPAKTSAKDPGHDDYTWSARVDHAALDGTADTHPADDVCPRSVTPPYETDPNPNGKIKDKGCGAKKPDKTFGAPVVVDVTVKP